jgi:hypothetical protein
MGTVLPLAMHQSSGSSQGTPAIGNAFVIRQLSCREQSSGLGCSAGR